MKIILFACALGVCFASSAYANEGTAPTTESQPAEGDAKPTEGEAKPAEQAPAQ